MRKLLLAVTVLAACGGNDGSGVDSNKQLKDLTADEVMAECQWGIDAQGGAGHQTMCADNVTVTVHTVAQCTTDLNGYKTNCTATVAQLEACTNALAANPCDFTASACTPIFACTMMP